jgi:hypothetical protein
MHVWHRRNVAVDEGQLRQIPQLCQRAAVHIVGENLDRNFALIEHKTDRHKKTPLVFTPSGVFDMLYTKHRILTPDD